jgi:hypothetical protein
MVAVNDCNAASAGSGAVVELEAGELAVVELAVVELADVELGVVEPVTMVLPVDVVVAACVLLAGVEVDAGTEVVVGAVVVGAWAVLATLLDGLVWTLWEALEPHPPAARPNIARMTPARSDGLICMPASWHEPSTPRRQ